MLYSVIDASGILRAATFRRFGALQTSVLQCRRTLLSSEVFWWWRGRCAWPAIRTPVSYGAITRHVKRAGGVPSGVITLRCFVALSVARRGRLARGITDLNSVSDFDSREVAQFERVPWRRLKPI